MFHLSGLTSRSRRCRVDPVGHILNPRRYLLLNLGGNFLKAVGFAVLWQLVAALLACGDGLDRAGQVEGE